MAGGMPCRLRPAPASLPALLNHVPGGAVGGELDLDALAGEIARIRRRVAGVLASGPCNPDMLHGALASWRQPAAGEERKDR
jgi:hypothetical protein